ncbi:hypothetical protein SBD_2211 [Streptomyces bottropensis ATCC 25435]|uniref:Uncharacterized protein n=1 Tax=Streptomyces bottropensis ATCC 25435 TaxID=1054862 RepID=M3FU09_9ACTN|nr:hypothetical protein SBD_2211 [Streptomyces bottropensis ATCC 25435]
MRSPGRSSTDLTERHSRLQGGKAYAVSRESGLLQSNTAVTLRDRSPRSVPEPSFDVTGSPWKGTRGVFVASEGGRGPGLLLPWFSDEYDTGRTAYPTRAC